MDVNGDGTVSFEELLHALRAADVTRAGAGSPAAAQFAAPGAAGKPPMSRQMTIAAMPGASCTWLWAACSVPQNNMRGQSSGVTSCRVRHMPVCAAPRPLSGTSAGGEQWVLQDVRDPNTGAYLKLDPATGLVYQEPVPGEWPQVVGVQDSTGVLRLTQRRDDGGLFAALDAYLRTSKWVQGRGWGIEAGKGGGAGRSEGVVWDVLNFIQLGYHTRPISVNCARRLTDMATCAFPCHPRVKFRDMFDHFDADRSGQLDMAELRQLVATILPGFTEGQLNYFQVRRRAVLALGRARCCSQPWS